MSNRTGKREREARNRNKRGYTSGSTRTGAPVRALKLGRRKQRAFSRSNRLDVGSCLMGGPAWLHWDRKDIAAVPVAEAERRMAGPKEPDRLADSPSTPSDDSTEGR